MMLMPGLNARQTGQVLGELRKRMEAHAFRVEMVGGQEKTLRKTASIGMTIIDPSTKPSFTNIYRIVDRALYFAKGKILGTDTDDPNGRNRVAECYDINKSPQLVVT
jgi:GGDEF domain-containing protein